VFKTDWSKERLASRQVAYRVRWCLVELWAFSRALLIVIAVIATFWLLGVLHK